MSSDKINWRDKNSYNYLSSFNADDFAFEFLRRNMNYQQTYQQFQCGQIKDDDTIVESWGLNFLADPMKTSQMQPVFWSEETDNSIVPFLPISEKMFPNTGNAITLRDEQIDFVRKKCGKQNIIIRYGLRQLRAIYAGKGSVTKKKLMVVVPLTDKCATKMKSIEELVEILSGKQVSIKNDSYLIKKKKQRLIHMLQAVDAAKHKATGRQIATAVFGDSLTSDDWRDSSIKIRTRKLLRDGLDMVERGYRKLLKM